MESGRYDSDIKEEKNDSQQKLTTDLMNQLLNLGGRTFFDKVFFEQYIEFDDKTLKAGPGKKPKFEPFSIVAMYMAYINNPDYRKIFAPYFLNALEACTPEEIAKLVNGTRPTTSETYRAIEKIGKTSKHIEAYVCYAFVTANINQLNIEELDGAISYLRKTHSHNIKILITLKSMLTALLYNRELNLATNNFNAFRFEPKNIPRENLTNILNKNFSNQSEERFKAAGPLLHFKSYNWAMDESEHQYYLNLAGANLTSVNFSWIPEFANFENSNLEGSHFYHIKFTHVNFSHSKLDHAIFSDCRFIYVDLRGAQFDHFEIDKINSFSYNRFPSAHLNMPPCFLIDHNTLRSETFRKLVENLEFHKFPNLPNLWEGSYIIQLSTTISNQESLKNELNLYLELEKKYSDNAVTLLRRSLVNASLSTFKDLSIKGIDTKPLYETALNHPCFTHRNKMKAFFNVEWSSSQKELIKGYEKISADLEKHTPASSPSKNSPY